MYLSKSIDDLKETYDVVVIGSGYGGSIAASRMARTNQSVCLLEKGKEIRAGDYPKREKDILKSFHVSFKNKTSGSSNNLYQLHMDDDIGVFHGCGLGGTSLINANVSLSPKEWVFKDESWPNKIRENLTKVYQGIERAKIVLEPTLYPESDRGRLAKVTAHKLSSRITRGKFYLAPINVKFKDGLNSVGVHQNACNNCGDCVSGCNIKAKNTTLMNYLPDAVRWGAEIYSECEVIGMKEQEGKWIVRILAHHNNQHYVISANTVFLGAGSLGSTKILLAAKEKGLLVSNKLGSKFTGNGDVLGFSYNSDLPINGIGQGDRPSLPLGSSGPCIASVIDLRTDLPEQDQMVIEEGVIPGGMAKLLPLAFLKLAKAFGNDTDGGFRDVLAEKIRELRSITRGAHSGAMQNTQTYLVMAHDSGKGKIKYKHGKIEIEWDQVGDEAIFQKINEKLREAASAIGGTFIHNPMWHQKMGKKLITVHPLGGCPMGDNAENGVVNAIGQVFKGTSGNSVYPNLIVCDGAIIPRPLGVNPLLTISGLAEYICCELAETNNWTINYN